MGKFKVEKEWCRFHRRKDLYFFAYISRVDWVDFY